MEHRHEESRLLVIDDAENIHADFRRVLATRSVVHDELSRLESEMFPNLRPRVEPTATYVVDSAMQGRDGYELVKQHIEQGGTCPYFAIFVDMRMPPGWNGLETMEKLWALDPSLQLVMCTAYSDYSREEIDARLGHSDRFFSLPKPFQPDALKQLSKLLVHRWGDARARVRRDGSG